MMQQWLKMLVLVLALLSQLAMACPRDAGQQSSSDASSGGPMQRGGGNAGEDREPLSTYKPFADLKDLLQRNT